MAAKARPGRRPAALRRLWRRAAAAGPPRDGVGAGSQPRRQRGAPRGAGRPPSDATPRTGRDAAPPVRGRSLASAAAQSRPGHPEQLDLGAFHGRHGDAVAGEGKVLALTRDVPKLAEDEAGKRIVGALRYVDAQLLAGLRDAEAPVHLHRPLVYLLDLLLGRPQLVPD